MYPNYSPFEYTRYLEPIKWSENDDLVDIDVVSHITGSHSAASSSNSSAILTYQAENAVPTVNDLLTLDGPWANCAPTSSTVEVIFTSFFV